MNVVGNESQNGMSFGGGEKSENEENEGKPGKHEDENGKWDPSEYGQESFQGNQHSQGENWGQWDQGGHQQWYPQMNMMAPYDQGYWGGHDQGFNGHNGNFMGFPIIVHHFQRQAQREGVGM